jgi:hypothetical protein
MSIFRLSFLYFLTLLPAFSQSQSTAGDVRGSVLDPAGSGINAASLTLSDPDRGFLRRAQSDAGGRFVLPLVPPGRYRLRVEADGFTTKVLNGVEVRVGDAVPLVVPLSIRTVETEVEVRAELEVAETERTQQANTLGEMQIRNLPINRRNYLDFALLAPGVVETTSLVEDTSYRPIGAPNSGLSFGASNGRGNGFYIDGLENYNGSSGVRLSLTQEMVQEFQLNRNSYSAEFGNASGGIINVISRSGSNSWRGNAFGFLRHRDIQARNYFDPAKSPFTRVQAGATAGGALRKDRTFVFAGLERLDRHESSFIPLLTDRSVFTRLTPAQQQLVDFFDTSGNPQLTGLAARMRQSLIPNAYPDLVQLFAANSGVFPVSEAQTLFGVRLDHRFSERHSLFLRGNTARSLLENSSFGALDAYNRGRSIRQSDATIALGDTFVFNGRSLLETRLLFNYNPFDIIPNDPIGPELNVAGFGLFGRQIFVPYYGIERHFQIVQNFSHLAGNHQLKFGWDFNPFRNSFESATFFAGRFGFGGATPLMTALGSLTGDPALGATLTGALTSSGRPDLIPNLSAPLNALQAFAVGLPTFYQQGFGDPNYVNFIKRLHFYAQDTWKARPDLTLSLGVRYENEFHNPIIPPDRNNIGPRVGLAWSPGDSRDFVIRAGYGLYYSQITTNAAGTADPLSGKFINQIFIPSGGAPGLVNAQNGRPLTPADVFQTLRRQGVIGSRPIVESDLAQFGLRAAPGLPFSVIFEIDKDLENPWAHQASLEIEKAIGGFAVSAGYNFNRAAHLARFLARNVAYTGQRLPDGRPTFTRIDPLVLQRNAMESSANSFYHAAILQVNRRFARGFSLNAHYTFSKAIDESTDFNSDYSPNDQLNHRAERALSPFHQTHRFVFSGIYQSQARHTFFRDWNVAPILQANSWRPFNVVTGVDLPSGGDGYASTKRPAHLGRNMGRGPNFFTFDMRLSRRFGLGAQEHRTVEIIAEGFNLFNRTNFRTVNNTVGDVPISSLPSPITANRGSATQPLAFTSALSPRQFQFGLKFNF